jgi:hypothetical protein
MAKMKTRGIRNLRVGDLVHYDGTFCRIVRRHRRRGEDGCNYTLVPVAGESWPDWSRGERGPVSWEHCSSPGQAEPNGREARGTL